MVSKVIEELASRPPPELHALIELLAHAANDRSYRELVSEHLEDSPNFERRRWFLEEGHFDESDFLKLVHACGDGTGTKPHIAHAFLQRLSEWGLVEDLSFAGNNALIRYRWIKDRIAMFEGLRILDNVLLGPGHVAKKYRRSVPAVFVERNGVEHAGTGFVAADRADASKYVVVTARHNINPSDGITFLGFGGAGGACYRPLADNWICDTGLDLALMPVACNMPFTPVFPVGAPSVLSRTITLGYPKTATSDEAHMLAHGGELNAIVKSHLGEEHLVISNSVAPASSGSPVLDESGLAIGMVVEAFEAKHEGGVNKANAAIPSRKIQDFIAPHCI